MRQRVAKRMTKATSGKDARVNDDIILIDDEYFDAPTTSQNHGRQSPATDEEDCTTMCEKYSEIDEKIEKCGQKIALAKNDKSRSVTLVKAYSEINKKIKKYEEEKKELEQQRDDILKFF